MEYMEKLNQIIFQHSKKISFFVVAAVLDAISTSYAAMEHYTKESNPITALLIQPETFYSNIVLTSLQSLTVLAIILLTWAYIKDNQKIRKEYLVAPPIIITAGATVQILAAINNTMLYHQLNRILLVIPFLLIIITLTAALTALFYRMKFHRHYI